MALKNQNNKNLKVNYLEENPSFKENKKNWINYHKTLEQTFWQKRQFYL